MWQRGWGELNQYFIIILSYDLRRGNLKMRKDKGRILVLMTMPNEIGFRLYKGIVGWIYNILSKTYQSCDHLEL